MKAVGATIVLLLSARDAKRNTAVHNRFADRPGYCECRDTTDATNRVPRFMDAAESQSGQQAASPET
jgi:hypothetical protein